MKMHLGMTPYSGAKRSNLFKNCVKILRGYQHFKGRFYPVKVTSFHIINGALLILNRAPLY